MPSDVKLGSSHECSSLASSPQLLTWAYRKWGHQMTLHQHFRPGQLSTHHYKRHCCWTSCQLQKRLALLKNNVAVRSPRISPGPQREGGVLQRHAALCSVQPDWGCYLPTAASCSYSVFFWEEQSTSQESLWEGLFWTWSLESTVCYITAAVMQSCSYSGHRLGLLIKESSVENNSSIQKKKLFGLLESCLKNKPWKKSMEWRKNSTDHCDDKVVTWCRGHRYVWQKSWLGSTFILKVHCVF